MTTNRKGPTMTELETITDDDRRTVLVARRRQLESELLTHQHITEELAADPHASDGDKTNTRKAMESLAARLGVVREQLGRLPDQDPPADLETP